ncbi:class I SAM-dependent methyltransferase [Alkalimarinus coralli]|uniref:class I SAM-dependent methyltransferase n=1 Tax=Alkalimarinus coralli TaxID=2935863 RepID=UPI00202B3CF0|nr:class I SAM-dependent methyltransferase [Alkalimarinus coralli]
MNELISEINHNIQRLNKDSGRVFHGRGKTLDGFEDITVEYLSGTLLVILFAERPVTWLKAFSVKLSETVPIGAPVQVLFQMRYLKNAPVLNESGEAVRLDKTMTENGLKYQLTLGDCQNFGFFTDMANGRKWVKAHSSGHRVLNLFSYTCSFSVAAISGGAEKVINIDMSSAALSVGRKNHQLNEQPLEQVVFQKLNILKSWGRIKKYGPYGLVIVDPPSFQKGSFSVSKDYMKVVKRLSEMTLDDADVLFCLNDPLVTVDSFKQMLNSEHFEFIERIENPEVMREAQVDVGLKVLHYKKRPTSPAVNECGSIFK